LKDLQTDFGRLKEILKQRDTLIEECGLILYTDNENKKKNPFSDSIQNTNKGDSLIEIKSVLPAALVAPDTAKLLDTLGEGTIDDKLRKLLSDNRDIKDQNTRLKIELEEERTKSNTLEKKLITNMNKNFDNESSHDLHEIQSMKNLITVYFKLK
jgi:hypothetical protein